MNKRSAGLLGLAGLAIFALWLLLAGPGHVLGLDAGKAGFALLMATAWGALYALYRWPRGELEGPVSPGEWKAWIGTVFMAQLTAYVLVQTQLFAGTTLLHSADARAIGSNVAMLVIAWLIVSSVLQSRWKGRVQEDERDREIDRIAANWGSGALTVLIIGIAVMLGLSPAHKLEWATPLRIAHLLIFALLWSGLVHYATTAIQYWRDRR